MDNVNYGLLTKGGAPTSGVSEAQQIAITGTPTGGTFTLTFGSDTTAAIAYDATAAIVQAALRLLAGIGSAGVSCSGGPLPGTPISVTFTGDLAGLNVAAMTEDHSGLTGGTDPAVAITTTIAGVRGDYRGVSQGQLLLDTTNRIIYRNTSTTRALPVWAEIPVT